MSAGDPINEKDWEDRLNRVMPCPTPTDKRHHWIAAGPQEEGQPGWSCTLCYQLWAPTKEILEQWEQAIRSGSIATETGERL